MYNKILFLYCIFYLSKKKDRIRMKKGEKREA